MLQTAVGLLFGATAGNLYHAEFPTYVARPPPIPPAGAAFNASFTDYLVLQQAPAKACVTGTLGPGATNATLTVAGDSSSYDIAATITEGSAGFKLWKACLKPQEASNSEYTLTASCEGCANSANASIAHVLFGEVWYCGGQSNMALPLMHTFQRNISRDAILGGKYSNLRIHGIAGNMNPTQPWTTLKDAIKTNNDSDKSAFGSFSSTCYYFGESLSDELAEASANGVPTPIGLVHTSYGGSTIEQWLTNKTIATCANASLSKANQEWHDQRVLPYIDMTVKGWVWYQGENDMHNYFGNSADHTGYSCLMKSLVEEWRGLWSKEAGTTAPDAPFGIVTLAPSGTEGGKSIGTMRWAQTASFGVAPNSALPNVFVAQAYDLNDPNRNISCYGKVKCHDNSPVPAGGWPVAGCDEYCASVKTTNFYMGPIHPRDKKPVGARLAKVGAVVAYGKKGHSTGPTIAGCKMAGGKITVTFNKTLMAEGGADGIKVNEYYDGSVAKFERLGSKMEVLVNGSLFCMQQGGKSCLDDGTGRSFDTPYDEKKVWLTVDIFAGASQNELVIDLSRTNGTAFAIRYANDGDCCSENPPTAEPCTPATCPIMGTASNLPANPFVAHIVDGKCKCVAPQICDA